MILTRGSPSTREIDFCVGQSLVMNIHKVNSSPVTGLEWPRGFQEVKVPRFHANGTG